MEKDRLVQNASIALERHRVEQMSVQIFLFWREKLASCCRMRHAWKLKRPPGHKMLVAPSGVSPIRCRIIEAAGGWTESDGCSADA